MFSSRAFNIALLISFLWHMTCIAAVNIVVLPGKFKVRELTAVSFLGPILEKTALDIMMANKPIAVMTSYESELKGGREVRDVKAETLQPADTVKKEINKQAEDKMNRALGLSFREVKDVPNIIKDSKKAPAGPSAAGDSGISGPIAGRKVFYKPPKPTVPEWIASGTLFNLELKFFVSAQGEVKEVIPVVSSGNAEIDLLGIRYLKGWKFTPTAGADSGSAKDAWGRIKIVLGKE